MAVTIDDFGASFIHYLPSVTKILNDTVMAKKYTKGNVKQWEGSKLVKHVHVGRSDAVGFIEDGGAIPPARQQRYQAAEAYRKFCVGKVAITDGMLNNAKTSKHAAVRVVDSELRGMMEGIKCLQNYFWTRDGTGVVTLMGNRGGTGTVNNTTTPEVVDARGIWDRGRYSIMDASTATIHDTFEVTSVSRAYDNTDGHATITATATVDSGSAVAAGDYVVWQQGDYVSRTAAGTSRVITGLDAGIATHGSTFQGINTATWTKYSSPVFAGASTSTLRDLTPDLLRKALGALVQEGGEIGELVALGNTWLMAQFDEMYESAIRITPDTETVGGATPTFQCSLGKVSIVHDKDSPYGKLFLFDPKEITYAVQKELYWRSLSNGSGGIFKRDDRAAQYTATAFEQAELFYEARNRFAKITELNEDVGSAF